MAASANGVSGDYFNVYGMTFSEGNTFNQEQLNGRAQVVVLDSNTRRQLFPIKQMWLASDSGRQYARQSHWCGGRKTVDVW